MTREEYLKEMGLTVLKDGTITSLGQFEAEMVYAPYFWDIACGGCAEELSFMQDGCGEYVALIEVDAEARGLFPELSTDTAFVGVVQGDQGFVSVTELTEERANEWRAEYAQSDCEDELA